MGPHPSVLRSGVREQGHRCGSRQDREAKHGIDMKDLAREFARLSPHRRKLVTA